MGNIECLHANVMEVHCDYADATVIAQKNLNIFVKKQKAKQVTTAENSSQSIRRWLTGQL